MTLTTNEQQWLKILCFNRGEVPTSDEISKRFKLLSRKHHPDIGGERDKFVEINNAYTQLTDRIKNGLYNHAHRAVNFEQLTDIIFENSNIQESRTPQIKYDLVLGFATLYRVPQHIKIKSKPRKIQKTEPVEEHDGK